MVIFVDDVTGERGTGAQFLEHLIGERSFGGPLTGADRERMGLAGRDPRVVHCRTGAAMERQLGAQMEARVARVLNREDDPIYAVLFPYAGE